MVQGLAYLIISLFFLRAWRYYKKTAHKRCAELSARIAQDGDRFGDAILLAMKTKTADSLHDFLKDREKAFLIEKGRSLTVYPLNNAKNQTILESQYRRLEKKLNDQNPAFTYSFESYSVFYRFPPPHENCILRIDK